LKLETHCQSFLTPRLESLKNNYIPRGRLNKTCPPGAGAVRRTGKRKSRACDPALFIQLVVELADDDDEASFDVGLDLQAARDCLVVVENAASFHVRFDFHTLSIFFWILTLNIARRRHILGFEAEGRRSPVHARTRRLFAHAAEIFLRAKKPGCEPGFVFAAMSAACYLTGSAPIAVVGIICSILIFPLREFDGGVA